MKTERSMKKKVLGDSIIVGERRDSPPPHELKGKEG